MCGLIPTLLTVFWLFCRVQALFEEIVAPIFLELTKNTNLQIEKAQ